MDDDSFDGMGLTEEEEKEARERYIEMVRQFAIENFKEQLKEYEELYGILFSDV